MTKYLKFPHGGINLEVGRKQIIHIVNTGGLSPLST